MGDFEEYKQRAAALDFDDPLAAARELFYLPENVIYLDGNSLGAAPLDALATLDVVGRKEWAQDLIASWNSAGWFELPSTLGAMVAQIIGAHDDEVVVCDSTSINIFKAVNGALSLRPERNTIVAEAGSFPTDLYMLEGVSSLAKDCAIRLQGKDGDMIESLIDEDVAVVLVNHVDYRTGEIRDIGALTKYAHERGALVIVDLCHSAGIMPVELTRHNIDLAIGCTYKYLNGGPGSPAFIYCARRHLPTISQPLTGWWGHSAPFAFDRSYQADAGIKKFLCGTQPVLNFRALQPGLEIATRFDIDMVREKSMALTTLFLDCVDSFRQEHGIGIASTRDANIRGSQISLTHDNGYEIVQAMIAHGVVGDFRMPNVMRFGFAPLYLRFKDVLEAANILHQILASGAWRDEKYAKRAAVT